MEVVDLTQESALNEAAEREDQSLVMDMTSVPYIDLTVTSDGEMEEEVEEGYYTSGGEEDYDASEEERALNDQEMFDSIMDRLSATTTSVRRRLFNYSGPTQLPPSA